MIDFISQPWPWYVAGPIIAFTMFGLLFSGKYLGVSSNLRTICSFLGAGKNCDFFDFNWKEQSWNLVFVVGLIGGGFIASQWLTTDVSLVLSPETQAELVAFGINTTSGLAPSSIFSWESLGTVKGLIMMIGGGFLVGFGTRYAGGCTSGHAISGLSNLQLPSLIAVIGFFIGGLLITYLVLPHLLAL
jgi:uncharacterized protein